MTNSCKEFVLDDVMAITAIPIENITSYSIHSPANNLTKLIAGNGFNPSYLNAITIGMQPAVAGGSLIPIKRFTGKAKDDESDSVAGRLHTVTVTCEVDDREAEVWNLLLTLERTNRHLILTFRDNSRAFVSATQDTYLCNTDRDGAKTSVMFRIQNLMGIQLLA